MTRSVAALFVLVLGAAACGGAATRRAPGADTEVIATAEIDASGRSDAYTLVQSLRPQWLRVRGPTSAYAQEKVKVYLDGSLLGGVEHLRQITTHSIASLRHLDGMEATQRWGLDHGAGAILVFTRNGP